MNELTLVVMRKYYSKLYPGTRVMIYVVSDETNIDELINGYTRDVVRMLNPSNSYMYDPNDKYMFLFVERISGEEDDRRCCSRLDVFHWLMKIICSIRLGSNMQVRFVCYTKSMNDGKYMKFVDLRNTVLSMNDEIRYKVFNNMINDSELSGQSTCSAICLLVLRANGKVNTSLVEHYEYNNDIEKGLYDKLMWNYERFGIEMLCKASMLEDMALDASDLYGLCD